MQDEPIAVRDLDEIREIGLILLHVDHARGVVEEHAEVVIDVKVDGRGLDAGLVERVDHDPARAELLTDRSVGEDHGPEDTVTLRHAGVVQRQNISFPS